MRWVGTAHLHETHSNSAHFGEFIHDLKTMVHRLCQYLSKLLVVENFQAGDLADSGGMKPINVVSVPTLHKDAAVTQALSIHFSSNIVQVDASERTDHVSHILKGTRAESNLATHIAILTDI